MREKPSQRNQFGTFAGVFTPSILTILGVIMFLRAGFVIGQAGIRDALLILAAAEGIALLTAFSLAAISTNTPVKGGGAYYLISRVLGPEFGGSIGLALFLAQALSVPFYILGFTHALVASFPSLAAWTWTVASITTLVLFIINYVGAHWAIKTQYIVMTILGLAIVAFMGGALAKFNVGQLHENWMPGYVRPEYGFWVIFAIYFPAVTGIMAGINMSGDLRDPARSLVKGTFVAVAVGTAIYALEILISGGAFPRQALINNPYALLVKNALFGAGFLVAAGVLAATLSSAMGSLMGAPRVLQALAKDDLVPLLRPFARTGGHRAEPRTALWLTLLVSLVVLTLATRAGGGGAFDVVASVVSMFFLATYGMVNVAAFVESFGLNPSFRPRFRMYHWSISLLGAVCCLVAMLLVDMGSAMVAVVVVALIQFYLSRRAYHAAFGDARRGFLYALIVSVLSRLERLPSHAKNWRPSLLVFSGNPDNRNNMIRFADWLSGDRGIISMAEIRVGDFRDLAAQRERRVAEMAQSMGQHRIKVYPETIIAEELDDGMRVVMQAQSVGHLKPNTILLGWPREEDRVRPFGRHLRDARTLGKNVVCLIDRGLPEGSGRRIDLWWRGRANGSLMVILAYLLSTSIEWKGSKIRILRSVESEEGRKPAYEALSALVTAARINAEIVVIVSQDPIETIIPDYSENASVVLMGFMPPGDADVLKFWSFHERLGMHVPTTVLISSNGEADLLA